MQYYLNMIKSEKDYNISLSRIYELMDAKPSTVEMDELERLTALADMYEEIHFPIKKPTPTNALKFRAEQMGNL